MMIIELAPVECSICGNKNFSLFRTHQELIDFRCMECRSSLMDIENHAIFENNIELIKREMI
jgi:hypothetical protein